ncbi:MAG: DUF2332 domain-containing protein [Dermatophilaceae bacterium]
MTAGIRETASEAPMVTYGDGEPASGGSAVDLEGPHVVQHQMAELCLVQARLCERLGSPMYAGLLEHVADDIRAGGPAWQVLEDLSGCVEGAYPALRLLGSVHRLVLQGRVPELARHYPSVGGTPGVELWSAFRGVLDAHATELRDLVRHPPQTNEVGRSAALLGGFATVAAESGLPLRVLEIGASAGLNLVWDHYRYRSGTWSWGSPDAAVCIDDVFAGPAPDLPWVRVAERAGCDLEPIDVTEESGRLVLRSFLWPDQRARQERLEAAVEVFRAVVPRPRVDRADALTWLPERLAESRPGVATVLTHSVLTTYLDDAARAMLDDEIERAGAAATADTPFARLSLETDDAGGFEVRLRSWPGGRDRLLGTVGGHGLPVRWHAGTREPIAEGAR